jgi:transcriptional antiterminator NusG
MEMENEKKDPTIPEEEKPRDVSDDGGEPLEAAGTDAPESETASAEAEPLSADGSEAEVESVESEKTDGEAEDEPETAAEETEPVEESTAAEETAPAKETRSRKASPKKSAKTKKAAPAGKKTTAGKAAVAVDEAPSESTLPMRWYVIHTYSGHENKVKENILKMVKTSTIKDQFGRLIVPTEEVAEMKKGKKMITTRKFFPSYILIEMYMSEDSWHLVNGIPGVTSFVGAGTKPQPLSEPEVERILGRMDKDRGTIIPEIPFTLGEHIRIKDGPFSDFTGIIDEINTEKGKLKVLVSIFGRETPVELDFLQVEPI